MSSVEGPAPPDGVLEPEFNSEPLPPPHLLAAIGAGSRSPLRELGPLNNNRFCSAIDIPAFGGGRLGNAALLATLGAGPLAPVFDAADEGRETGVADAGR